MTIDPKELLSVDPGYWAMVSNIKLQKGLFSFEGREYQVEVMSDKSRRQCDMKGTQGGFSEMRMLRILHGMIFKRYPGGVLYMFPTGDEVSEFSKSRFGPLIHANYNTIGKYLKNVPGSKTDSTSLKQVRGSNLYMRGARLGQKIEGDLSESSKMRAITVDAVVYDELDMMDTDVIGKANERMGDSTVGDEIYISNPTLPDYGIDLLFQESDQRYWFRQCKCGHWTSAELSYPMCVQYYKTPMDGKLGYVACEKCGKELGIAPGKWIPQRVVDYKDPQHIVGRRWSQLTNPKRDPGLILNMFNDPPNGNLADIYRYKLGLPYVSAADKLQVSQILSCCGPNISPTSDPGPCAMGVDIGQKKHVVIGKRIGLERYLILRATEVNTWNDIHDLALRYNVKMAVIDIRPYEDSARDFQSKEPYQIYLCQYDEFTTHGAKYDANSGLVKVNRTENLDATHRMFTTPGMITLPRLDPEVKEFARQMCNTAKREETNKVTGLTIYRYKATGDKNDHFRHAFGYFQLAAALVPPVKSQGTKRQRRAIHKFQAA